MRTSLLFLLLFSVFSTYAQDIVVKDSLGGRIDFYFKQLQVEYRNGHYENHKNYSDSLYVLAKEKGLIKFQILGMVNQAVYYKNSNEYDKAIELYRESLLLCDSIPEDYRTKIIVLVNLGNVYNRIEEQDRSITTMNKVLVLLDEKEDNPKIRASVLNTIGSNYEDLGEYEKAISYRFQAKELGESVNDESIVVTALNNIANTYYLQEDYKKVIEIGEATLEMPYAKKPTTKRAWLLLNLGISEARLGDVEKALDYIEEAKNIGLAEEIVEIEMIAYKHLAEVYDLKKLSSKAKEFREKYFLLKNESLQNQKKATKIDLEKDINEKDKIIAANRPTLSSLLKNRNNLIVGVILLLLLLVSTTIFYRKKQSDRERETNKLRAQLKELKIESTLMLKQNTEKINVNKVRVQYKNSSLTNEDYIKYKDELLVLMNTEKPFLEHDLSQVDLAKKLGISSHHLSEVLRFSFDQNFYNFINTYRVLEAQKLMEDHRSNTMKILAIAFESGFQSKTSFNRVFKLHTGMTPSEFRKKSTS